MVLRLRRAGHHAHAGPGKQKCNADNRQGAHDRTPYPMTATIGPAASYRGGSPPASPEIVTVRRDRPATMSPATHQARRPASWRSPRSLRLLASSIQVEVFLDTEREPENFQVANFEF
jgi:hypothetical protein